MALTTIEIMALIIILLSAIKIIVILVNPKSWLSVVKAVYGNPVITMIVALVLAGLTLRYLLVEITIVQIFAVILFIALLSAISVAAYSKEIIALATKMLKDRNIVKKAWLAILIWIVLIVWAVYVLFA